MFAYGRTRNHIFTSFARGICRYGFRTHALLTETGDHFRDVLVFQRDRHRVARTHIVGEAAQEQLLGRPIQAVADHFQLALADVNGQSGDVRLRIRNGCCVQIASDSDERKICPPPSP